MKFYIESGNFKKTICDKSLTEAVWAYLRQALNKSGTNLGTTLRVTEFGFLSEIDDYYEHERKIAQQRVIKQVTLPLQIQPEEIICYPIVELLDLMPTDKNDEIEGTE